MGDLRRQHDQDAAAIEELENYRKKVQRDLEQMQEEKEGLEALNAKLEKTKKRLTGEVSVEMH